MKNETRDTLKELLLLIAKNIQDGEPMDEIASDIEDAQKIAEQLFSEECD
jgi:hypothetical protein